MKAPCRATRSARFLSHTHAIVTGGESGHARGYLAGSSDGAGAASEKLLNECRSSLPRLAGFGHAPRFALVESTNRRGSGGGSGNGGGGGGTRAHTTAAWRRWRRPRVKPPTLYQRDTRRDLFYSHGPAAAASIPSRAPGKLRIGRLVNSDRRCQSSPFSRHHCHRNRHRDRPRRRRRRSRPRPRCPVPLGITA